jgi:flagellar hook-basal body protein
MFSGVAGMKTHQTKLDVIGNNIANVNTYGYKSQRAVFSDIFYQTLTSASQGTASRGGTNPSTIGYGSTLGAVQTQMSQSSMQNTGFGLDVAITGEGFLQVMDPDGNIFYTKAGLLDYDANGYLVDMNGNFVLGATSVDGAPNVQKIRLDAAGAVAAAQPTITQTIGGVDYTVKASKADKAGNVLVTLASSQALPIGQDAQAVISAGGSIAVTINSTAVFSSLGQLNDTINKAITEANGGKEHPGGIFTITANKNVFETAAVDPSVSGSVGTNDGGITISGVSAGVTSSGAVDFSGLIYVSGTPGNLSGSISVGGVNYTLSSPVTLGTNPVTAQLTGAGGNITITIPAEAALATNLSSNAFGFTGYTITPAKAAAQITLTGSEIINDNFNVKTGEITGLNVTGLTFEKTSSDFGAKFDMTTPPTLSDVSITYRDPNGIVNDGDDSVDVKLTVLTSSGPFEYEGSVPVGTVGSSLLLKNAANGDYIQVQISDFATLANYTGKTDGSLASGLNSGTTTVTPSVPSHELGLGSLGFSLTGGTAGGVITLDELTSIAIGADGTVSVSHPDKGTISVGKVSLANFANPRGLMQSGTNYYTETVNSGKPVLTDPGSGGTGALKANALEMSNVDLAQEFADMITTQRGFQANTRVITVSDTMLEELINLKR